MYSERAIPEDFSACSTAITSTTRFTYMRTYPTPEYVLAVSFRRGEPPKRETSTHTEARAPPPLPKTHTHVRAQSHALKTIIDSVWFGMFFGRSHNVLPQVLLSVLRPDHPPAVIRRRKGARVVRAREEGTRRRFSIVWPRFCGPPTKRDWKVLQSRAPAKGRFDELQV